MRTELVTTLKRRATEIIAELQGEKEPVLITQHGKTAAYLVDVDRFEELNRRLSVMEGIALVRFRSSLVLSTGKYGSSRVGCTTASKSRRS